MTLAPLIPGWRGGVALAAAFAEVVILPALIPAHDGPPLARAGWALAVGLIIISAAGCCAALWRGRTADRIAGAMALALSAWMIYIFFREVI
jgi:hypothetical protein